MKPLIISLALILFISCTSPNEHTLTIENDSFVNIDSARIRARNVSVPFPSIAATKRNSQKYVIDSASDYEDAYYATIYFSDTTIVVPSFGYHSNTRSIKDITLVINKQRAVREK
jgi:hypothetical protein